MNLSQLHALLEVGAKGAEVHKVPALLAQVGDHFCSVGRAAHFVLGTQLELFVAEHLVLHVEAHLCQRI